MSEPTDRVLGGYRIEAEIGRGGQGTVYRATQLSLRRTVALKVAWSHLSSDERFRRRFTREGIAAASLDHPHVIPVHEAGEADGLAYLAMKLVAGPSLRELIEEGIGARRALAILRQVASALDYLASRGMVHRDVKPANVLVGPGDHAYLCDFGLVSALDASQLTESGAWMGTLDYISPEQIRGGPVTPAADRYALAAIAHQALAGRPPFAGEDRAAVVYAHLHPPPPPASALRPELGAGVDRALARGLAKEPSERHPTALALVEELERALPAAAAERAPALSPTAAIPTIRVPRRRRTAPAWLAPALAGAAAMAVLAGAAVGALVATGALGGDQEPAAAAVQEGQVRVVESGFVRYDNAIVFAVQVENTGDRDALDVSLPVRIEDGEGAIINADDADPTIAAIPARSRFWYAGYWQPPSGEEVPVPRRLVASPAVDENQPARLRPIRVEDARVSASEYTGDLSVSARITNTLDQPLDSLAGVYIVALDGDGEVVSARSTFLNDPLAPGATIDFSTTASGEIPRDERIASVAVSVEPEIED